MKKSQRKKKKPEEIIEEITEEKESDESTSENEDISNGPRTITINSYGDWNRKVRNQISNLGHCDGYCPISVSNKPFEIVSPYGSSVAFDPMVDNWQGEWRGPIEGFRRLDPDGEGILDHRWTGTAILRIDSSDWSEVKFLLTGANYLTVEGSRSGVGVDNIPQVEMSAPQPWTSRLSEVQGQKGYFEGNGLWGQFGRSNGTPSSVTGHLDRAGHVATFTAQKQ